MTEIVLDGETKVTSSHQIDGKYRVCLMMVFITFVSIAVILLGYSIRKRPESAQLLSIEAYEKVVATEMNNRIIEIEQKFKALSVNSSSAFRILEERLNITQNCSAKSSEDSLMAESEMGENNRNSKDATEEVEAIPDNIKDMVQDYQARINESINSLKVSIAELKNVTSANTDTIYVLINELVAKCNWLQEKMGL